MSSKSNFRKVIRKPVQAKPARSQEEINQEYRQVVLKAGEATIAKTGAQMNIDDLIRRVSELSAEMQERIKLDAKAKENEASESEVKEDKPEVEDAK